MKLPKLNDLIDEQMKVYEHPPDKHLFVAGPPGSGKTSLAVWRAKFLMVANQRVIVVTKNRMLAELVQQLGATETTTMQSHVWRDHCDRAEANPPELEAYAYDWNQILKTYAGKKLSPHLDHMVIDEGQNLPPEFFVWAVKFGARTLTVFADEDQATDEHRSSLKDISDAGMPPPQRLTANHRNTEEIALVAEHFHQGNLLPPGVVRRGKSGETPVLLVVGSWDEAVDRIVKRYGNRAEAIGVIVCRRKDALDLHERLRKRLPPPDRVDVYVSGLPKGAVIGIRCLDRGITVLTSESVIGLEFDTVYLQDLHRSLPCRSAEQHRRMYMLCARARDSLILVNGPKQLSAAQVAALPGPNLLVR